MADIYVTVLRLQEPAITKHCFGDCGKALLAAYTDPDLGALCPCAQAVCPHIETQSDEPLWTDTDGRSVYLRKIRS